MGFDRDILEIMGFRRDLMRFSWKIYRDFTWDSNGHFMGFTDDLTRFTLW